MLKNECIFYKIMFKFNIIVYIIVYYKLINYYLVECFVCYFWKFSGGFF